MLQRTFLPLRRDISVVGFGTWPIGGTLDIAGSPFGRGEVPEDRANVTLRYALDDELCFLIRRTIKLPPAQPGVYLC